VKDGIGRICFFPTARYFQVVNRGYQKFQHIWLQDSELKSWLSAYSADSKAFCEVCNDAIIPKSCELKRRNW